MSVCVKQDGQLVKTAGLYRSGAPIGIADIYTEGERQIGVWTDGKPLYQKTIYLQSIDITTSSSGMYYYAMTTANYISNAELILGKTEMSYVITGGQTRILEDVEQQDTLTILWSKISRPSVDAVVTLQYTKTTDSSTGVLPKSASALYLLGDVEISNLQDGDVLKYDDDDNKWKNGVADSGSSKLIELEDVDLENIKNGDAIIYDVSSEKFIPASSQNMTTWFSGLNMPLTKNGTSTEYPYLIVGKAIKFTSGRQGDGIYFKNNTEVSKTIYFSVLNGQQVQYGVGNANGTLPTMITTGANRSSFNHTSGGGSFTVGSGLVGYVGAYPDNVVDFVITSIV